MKERGLHMTDKLIIVESPAKANTIKKFLGGNTKVVASMGHIRDLPKSKLGIDEKTLEPEYINIRGKGDLIKSLKSMGCSGNDTKTQCLNKQKPAGGGSISGVQIPSTNGTYMPIARGRVTSDYGSRSGDYHTGIDFSNSKYGDNVYSVASGKVILVQSPGTYTDGGKNCGNWIIYVLHNINGHAYVTSYWHLSSPSVSKGQMVTANTVVGKMGGLHSVDACSFGVHVHLNLFDGNTWDLGRPNSGRINPRRIMPQIPKQGVYFTR